MGVASGLARIVASSMMARPSPGAHRAVWTGLAVDAAAALRLAGSGCPTWT
jgi:hypothetical protein